MLRFDIALLLLIKIDIYVASYCKVLTIPSGFLPIFMFNLSCL